MKFFALLFAPLCLLLVSCGRSTPDKPQPVNLATASWEQIAAEARGQTVTLAMWQGDPLINDYMKNYVAPALKQQHDVTLNIVGNQGNDIVSTLMTEAEAGKEESSYDLMWINGETFYQLRQVQALHGPFVAKLPNAAMIDFGNRFINTDFQQPVDGYECPWGNVQLAIIYDTVRVPNPPRTRQQLEDYVKAHPGTFTFDNSFTGMTFLKSLLIDIAGGEQQLAGPFDSAKYAAYSAQLWEYINRLKPYFWKGGKTYPTAVAPLHQMFANGEVNFTMSNNDGEVDNKVLQGIFPGTARAYVLQRGTIQNSHYMGIPKRSPHKAGAMVVCNFLISPEAQLRKLDPTVWGDGTVLDINRLPAQWQQKFRNLPGRKYAPPRETIQAQALMELAPEYMIRLFDDFRKYVIQKQS
ncbi:MAG: ABC transporter substrate-binding protein [Chlorobi bacterium]|nr:ABC transporter substrate-binding protein [Chlorobiota bacterium]